MSILDGILKNIAGAPDDVDNVARQAGTDPATAEKAIATLGKTHQMDGDTVQLAAQKTGLSPALLNRVVAAIGGEQSLSRFGAMLDRDGDGNPVDDVLGMANGLFGKS